ncbi:MAG: hypothetical protein U0Y68_16900 [Blastocatellia bacterium]
MSQREQIVRYLLGQQADEEREQIEQDYFANAAFLSEVQAACDDLIDDYLHERMSPSERATFAQRLHALPFLRERLATERALLLWARSAPPVLKQRRAAAFAAIPSQFTSAWLLPCVAAALLALVAMGAGMWYAVRNGSPATTAQLAKPSASPAEVATPWPAAQPSDSARPMATPAVAPAERLKKQFVPVRVSLLLSAEQVRSKTELPTLSLPHGKGRVRLQLEVPPVSPQTSAHYRAVLRDAAQMPRKRWLRLAPRRYQTDWILTLLLPTELLHQQDYSITLQGPTTITYHFHVQPQ